MPVAATITAMATEGVSKPPRSTTRPLPVRFHQLLEVFQSLRTKLMDARHADFQHVERFRRRAPMALSVSSYSHERAESGKASRSSLQSSR